MPEQQESWSGGSEQVTTAATRANSAIQVDSPTTRPGFVLRWFKKKAFRPLPVLGTLAGLLFLAILLGLVPCSFCQSTVAGRSVSVVSYHYGISVYGTPGATRIETGGRVVIVQGDVVDLGNGRTITLPAWCTEVKILVRDGKVAVTFQAP